MEKKQIEVKTFKTVYVAADGKQFNESEVCVKYEDSLACVLRSQLKEMSLAVGNEYSILGTGDEEHDLYVVVPKDTADILKIKQLLYAMGNKTRAEELKDTEIGKVLLIIFNCDDDYAWWMSLDQMVSRITDGKYEAVKKAE